MSRRRNSSLSTIPSRIASIGGNQSLSTSSLNTIPSRIASISGNQSLSTVGRSLPQSNSTSVLINSLGSLSSVKTSISDGEKVFNSFDTDKIKSLSGGDDLRTSLFNNPGTTIKRNSISYPVSDLYPNDLYKPLNSGPPVSTLQDRKILTFPTSLISNATSLTPSITKKPIVSGRIKLPPIVSGRRKLPPLITNVNPSPKRTRFTVPKRLPSTQKKKNIKKTINLPKRAHHKNKEKPWFTEEDIRIELGVM